jgi:hypothetical protein
MLLLLKNGAAVAIPVFNEKKLYVLDRRALNFQVRIAPSLAIEGASCIFSTDIDAPDKGCFTVNDQYLAVITFLKKGSGNLFNEKKGR